MRITYKAAINHTFNARPDLKKVHVLPSGEHYFDLGHAEQALKEGEEITTLARDAKELQPDKVAKA